MKKFGLLVLSFLLIGVTGCGTPSLLITPVSHRSTLQEETVRRGSRDKVAIIEVEGMLLNSRTGGLLQPNENKLSLFVQELEKAAADKRVKAVVLRINSPGGTVTASDTMYQALLKFKETTNKKVVASTQDLTASGAYLVACGSDRIVAHPTSVIGSIGVIFNSFDVVGTMGMLGVRANAIKSGPLKDMGSPFHALSDEERAVMQQMVDDYYARFVQVVTTQRPIDPANVKLVTDGRVFTGERAVALGLADETGTLDHAIEVAEQLAGITKSQVVLYRRPYGYSGSIYANSSDQTPQANVLSVEIPGMSVIPTGFYYMWQP